MMIRSICEKHFFIVRRRGPRRQCLSQSASLTLRLEQAQDVILTDYKNKIVSIYCSFFVAKLRGKRSYEKPCGIVVPGPLTLRMMLLVWSSMNSTRTWVTPPREPVMLYQRSCSSHIKSASSLELRESIMSSTGDWLSYRCGRGRG